MNPHPPLAVDLDGTLILSDTLHKGIIGLLKQSPLKIIPLARSLSSGKAAVKRGIAEDIDFDPAVLPYNQEFLGWLRKEHASGRRIDLFTAADQSIAHAVAAHPGLFDVVRGSDGITNLSGTSKAAAIEAVFGPVDVASKPREEPSRFRRPKPPAGRNFVFRDTL
jgi:hypothetical protein